MLVKPVTYFRRCSGIQSVVGGWNNRCLHNGYEVLERDGTDITQASQLSSDDYGLVARKCQSVKIGDSYDINVDLNNHTGSEVFMSIADTIACQGGVIGPLIELVDGNNVINIPALAEATHARLMISTYSLCDFQLIFNDIQFNEL